MNFLLISIGQFQPSFSLHLSQHLCSFVEQLLVLVNESPLPHLGIRHDIFVPGTQRVWNDFFAAGPHSINLACMAFDGVAAAFDILHNFSTIVTHKLM